MLPIPTDPWFYVLGILVTFLIGFSKGAFGGGLAILGVPLLAPVLGPLDAAITTAYLVAAMDLFALRSFGPRHWSKRDIAWLITGLMIGITIGWLVFTLVDPRWIGLVIGTVTLAFAAQFFLMGEQSLPAIPVMPSLAVLAGSISGFTTFVAHAGSPPVAMYMMARRLDKTNFVATSIGVFMIGNYVKLIPYTQLGLQHPRALWAVLVLLPMVPIGVWVGVKLHERMDRRRLFFWCYVLLTLAAGKLVYSSLASLLA